jgi:YD repeat-containing protein
MTYPDGSTVDYTYNQSGLMTSVTDEAGSVTTYTYDTMNRLSGEMLPNDVTTTYAYDILSRVVRMATANDDGSIISAHTYEYDELSNMTIDLEEVYQNKNHSELCETSYTYDALINS